MNSNIATNLPDDPAIRAIIEKLGLVPHPAEGGWFKETYRSRGHVEGSDLPARYGGSDRNYSTAIYYLVTRESFSALHKLQSDEVFHFYAGDAVEQLVLHEDGTGKLVTLGSDIAAGEVPQHVVKRGDWQGAKLVDGGKYALLGCTVAPGFDFADYTHGNREALCNGWPDFTGKICELTPEG